MHTAYNKRKPLKIPYAALGLERVYFIGRASFHSTLDWVTDYCISFTCMLILAFRWYLRYVHPRYGKDLS